uniref:Uncharacterized protein n=1 Tax=Anguilla anguilla TaxID=7936 RepID=A0A0E9Q7L2_ANGAN
MFDQVELLGTMEVLTV